MVLDVFPERGLDQSLLVAVLVGVYVLFFFTVGHVAAGSIASLANEDRYIRAVGSQYLSYRFWRRIAAVRHVVTCHWQMHTAWHWHLAIPTWTVGRFAM